MHRRNPRATRKGGHESKLETELNTKVFCYFKRRPGKEGMKKKTNRKQVAGGERASQPRGNYVSKGPNRPDRKHATHLGLNEKQEPAPRRPAAAPRGHAHPPPRSGCPPGAQIHETTTASGRPPVPEPRAPAGEGGTAPTAPGRVTGAGCGAQPGEPRNDPGEDGGAGGSGPGPREDRRGATHGHPRPRAALRATSGPGRRREAGRAGGGARGAPRGSPGDAPVTSAAGGISRPLPGSRGDPAA